MMKKFRELKPGDQFLYYGKRCVKVKTSKYSCVGRAFALDGSGCYFPSLDGKVKLLRSFNLGGD